LVGLKTDVGYQFVLVANPTMLLLLLLLLPRKIFRRLLIHFEILFRTPGQGLITSKGDLWQKQRFMLSAAFRIEILEETAVLCFVRAFFDIN
jgi:hypothetical protein